MNKLHHLPPGSAVQHALGGPDDNRRLVELVAGPGKTILSLPRRLNTLSASDQDRVVRLLADHLGIPLRTVMTTFD